jgi:uncharacterized membrane protein YjjP (DUF1212 family)/uncharacterized membrane protein YjjB (DUF3815 family)
VKQPSKTSDVRNLLEFMFRLGQALLGCGEQTAKVELILRRTASAYGMRRSRVVVFPTALFISVTVDEEERVTLAEGPTQALRLDQIADVYLLSDAAQRGEVPPKEGVTRLSEIYSAPARFGPLGVIVGHTILTVGLAMILTTAAESIAATGVLGAVVGLFKVFNRNRAVFAVPLPVISATIVSVLVFVAVKMGFPLDPRCAIIPPLVSFLPGGMLTLGMVELAYGDMVSGASRLISGFVQLLLLAFGLAAGAMIVGYHPGNLVDTSVELASSGLTPAVPWLPWVGVLVFGLGAYLHFSAPSNSLLWMLLVLLVAFATEQTAAELIGNTNVSGFFAMLVVTPLGYLIQLRFRGPPAIVTFLPSFWLLVPGALGLLSVTSMFSDRDAGIDGLIDAIFALVSIALGSLVGASIYKWLTETFGWWQLQIGRVERYMRRK